MEIEGESGQIVEDVLLCLPDVTFVVQNERIPAHRQVLATKNAYFRGLLEEGHDDNQQLEITLAIPLEAFKILIEQNLAENATIRWGKVDKEMYCITFDLHLPYVINHIKLEPSRKLRLKYYYNMKEPLLVSLENANWTLIANQNLISNNTCDFTGKGVRFIRIITSRNDYQTDLSLACAKFTK